VSEEIAFLLACPLSTKIKIFEDERKIEQINKLLKAPHIS